MDPNLLTRLEQFAEKAFRPGLLGIAGQKVERDCASLLRAYFNGLKTKIGNLHLEDRAYDDNLRHSVEIALANVLRHSQVHLKDALFVSLEKAFQVGYKMTQVKEAPSAKELDLIQKLGDSGQRAADWAETQAAQLVTGIDETTIDRIASAIAQGIEEQLGAPGTGRLIRAEMDDMSTSRALTIASTEVNRAMSTATIEKLKDLEIEYKQWILDADPCEICQENADAGPIPVDEDFPSGDDTTPAHPNCRCAVVGARNPNADDEDTEESVKPVIKKRKR